MTINDTVINALPMLLCIYRLLKIQSFVLQYFPFTSEWRSELKYQTKNRIFHFAVVYNLVNRAVCTSAAEFIAFKRALCPFARSKARTIETRGVNFVHSLYNLNFFNNSFILSSYSSGVLHICINFCFSIS